MAGKIETAKIWKAVWRKTASKVSKWDDLSQFIYEILCKEIRDLNNKEILEAGSGTGRISFQLARNGAKMTLLDVVYAATDAGKRFFEKGNTPAVFVCGSLFEMPFKDGSFDIVWNAGVLEHFSEEDRISALRNMVGVCKKNGLIITLNPFHGAIFYRIGKWIAEKRGMWMYGYEKPIKTLKKYMNKCDVTMITEYPTAFYEQFTFLSFIPFMHYFVRIINGVFKRHLRKLNLLPGYLLVSIGKKSDDNENSDPLRFLV